MANSANIENWDVVIVGSGFAGVAAGIEAARLGARTVILEKMPTYGGNSIIDEGMVSFVQTPQQQERKIKDSALLLREDMLVNGEYLNDPEKVDRISREAHSLYEWTTRELGIQWLPVVTWAGGHSVPRTLTVQSGSGKEIYEKALQKLLSYGVQIRCNTYVEHIDRTEDGVMGVHAKTNYNFPHADSGTPTYFSASKGIVLAYGGFSADVEYRSAIDPLYRQFETTNQPGATGELWIESSRIGCMLIDACQIQCTPWSNPREKGMGRAWLFSDFVGADAGLWVTSLGDRFVNELGNRKNSAEAVLNVHRQNLRALAVGNHVSKSRLDAIRPGFMDEMLSLGLIDRFESLEEIERAWNMPSGRLRATVLHYNKALKARRDRDFLRPIQCDIPLTEGPWYVAEMSPKVHHCMGGLYTNSDAQCIDAASGNLIARLYAAGECAGGVHGACRMGSCAILDCLIMGRIAGRNAAQNAG